MMPCANTAALRRYEFENPGFTAAEERDRACAEGAWKERAVRLICEDDTPGQARLEAFAPGLPAMWAEWFFEHDHTAALAALLRRRDTTMADLQELVAAQARVFIDQRIDAGQIEHLTTEDLWDSL